MPAVVVIMPRKTVFIRMTPPLTQERNFIRMPRLSWDVIQKMLVLPYVLIRQIMTSVNLLPGEMISREAMLSSLTSRNIWRWLKLFWDVTALILVVMSVVILLLPKNVAILQTR